MSYSINKQSFVNTIEYKKELKREIEKLRTDEHLEIFKIIKTDKNNYTENNNGIFINLKNLDVLTLHKIGNFVKYCKENVEKFYKYEDLKKNILDEVETEKNNQEKKNIDIDYNNYIIEENNDLEDKLMNDIKNISSKKTDITEDDNKSEIETFKYPKIINKNPKLYGVGSRLIKKCKSMDSQTLSIGKFLNLNDGKDGENYLNLYRDDELKLDKI